MQVGLYPADFGCCFAAIWFLYSRMPVFPREPRDAHRSPIGKPGGASLSGVALLGRPNSGTPNSRTLVMADQLATDIIEKIKAHAEPEGNEITVSTELGDLGIHSLELTEIVFDLEEAYGIEIEMNTVEAWNNLKNVGDIVEATRTLIAAKG
jgi:nodulation protein F